MIAARPVKSLFSPQASCAAWKTDRQTRVPVIGFPETLRGETAVHWQSSVPRLHASSLCASLQLFYSGTRVYLTAFWTGYKLDSLPEIINQSA